LIKLDVSCANQNQLNGTPPAKLGDLTSLVNLTLADNELTGPTPAGFGLLTNLALSHVNDNKLTGTMPVELGSLDQPVAFASPKQPAHRRRTN
jgi:hypothetical protein